MLHSVTVLISEISNRLSKNLGLVVAPLYRGKGIERELLNVIKPICAAHGAYVFTGTFTSDPHNELAEELGFKVKKEIK